MGVIHLKGDLTAKYLTHGGHISTQMEIYKIRKFRK